jgi:hypothetical protein
MMRALIIAAAIAAVLSSPAQATELPSCLNSETQALFRQAAQSTDHLYIKEIASDDASKRWCFIQFFKNWSVEPDWSSILRNRISRWESSGTVSLEAVFTLEWINEANGKYWLQIKEQHRLRCYMNARYPRGTWPAQNLCPGATASGSFERRQ